MNANPAPLADVDAAKLEKIRHGKIADGANLLTLTLG
jgi:hypothetical protein